LGGTLILVIVLTQGVARPMIWEIPAGYQGWVLVQFDETSCPPPRAEGIFEVLVVGADGRACVSSGPPHGWQYVRYVAVGSTGKNDIDRSTVTPWAVNNEMHRKTLYVGSRDQADPQRLPADWR
jgi:hypothetical protein